jgi:ABC-type dipeptide/oligopeptide/nickel transport system ATPase subunit
MLCTITLVENHTLQQLKIGTEKMENFSLTSLTKKKKKSCKYILILSQNIKNSLKPHQGFFIIISESVSSYNSNAHLE